ncbi:ABC transporter ATP-binding protein [Solimonas marina]|uniref:ATP-binding cassette domain-containing protein n=1 Tax=Solimonas marina TaxID=2714601 RepID=A0A969WBV6_9GAMM|nr:oligopeptide/dipeptide ABC transporter ATP-binding protein [Solimonas marina]NKF24317.1 ATP-binding cassette domain-containing protein [Solimonas marina]
MSNALLSVRDLRVQFDLGRDGWFGARRVLHAVGGVSFELARGETLGIVGESGCGKSSLARAILRLTPASGGQISFQGEDLLRLDAEAMRQRRRALQPIFQDPLASLNPRMTVGEIIGEPLRAFFSSTMPRDERRQRVLAMMQRVGLLPNQINRYAHEFSGGQAQRIGIARALVLEPELVVCDEPVSALDVSIKSQIINLLQDLQEEMGLSLLFVAHDLAAVRHISHRVMVLYLGRVMELADRDALYRAPQHPYTRALIAAIPDPDPRRARAHPAKPLGGEPPSPVTPPSGCVFRTRCPHARARCTEEVPALRSVGGSQVACHFAEELTAD